MDTVHNHEQIIAWRPDDLRALIGSRVAVRQPVDDRAFWTDPHAYTGAWEALASGAVVDADYRLDSGGYSGRLVYADGSWFGWVSGQPIYITETKEQR